MIFCESCGKQISDTAKFCKGCGTPVSQEAEPETVAPPLGPSVPQSKKRVISKEQEPDVPMSTVTQEEYEGVPKATTSVNSVKNLSKLASPKFIIFLLSAMVFYLGWWLYQDYNYDESFRIWISSQQSSLELFSGLYFVAIIMLYVLFFSRKEVGASSIASIEGSNIAHQFRKGLSSKGGTKVHLALPQSTEESLPQEELVTEEAPSAEEEPPNEEDQVEVVPYKE